MQIGTYLRRLGGLDLDRSLTLRLRGNSGEANNFTSVDLFQRPPLCTRASLSWLVLY